MERSKTQSPPPDADAPDSDPSTMDEKALPHAQSATDAEVMPPELNEAQAVAIDQVYFDQLERETTQPVRRPLSPIVAATIAAEIESVIAPPPAEVDAAPAEADARPPYAPAFEPRPFSVPPPQERPAFEYARPAAEADLSAHRDVETTTEPPNDSPSDLLEPEPEREPEPEPEPAARSEPALERPSFPRPSFESSFERPAAPSPTPAPPSAPSPSSLPAYVPHPAARPEPSFERPSFNRPSYEPPTAAAAPSLSIPAELEAPERATSQRDWRDVVRRAANAAFLVFAGWLIAVLLLVVAYRFINPPFSMLMVQRLLTGTPVTKQWVPIERISPNLTRAVIVAEDGRFCQHWGIDLIEAANAIRRASDGYPRGASTISMQTTKNLFLVPAKSYLRKMIEVPLTFAIELVWPKRRILEIYLNIVEWGPGIFGAEAASQAHFGRSAASLTPRQAAQLAAVLPNPIVRDAGAPGPRTARKASTIQGRAARTREASACIDIRR